jgi:hypothetical protein
MNNHGKLITYSVCVQRLCPFAAPLRTFIGALKCERDWDTAQAGPALACFKRVLTFLREHLQPMMDIGSPIWQLEASTLYYLWSLDRLPPRTDVVVITWDASAFGVGFSFRETPRKILRCEGSTFDHVSSVATFNSELEAQPHREAWGGAIAVRCFVERVPKPGTIIICVNDCSGVLCTLRKWSNKPNMQSAAEQFMSDCFRAGIFPTFLHVSGEALIEDGHDDASRSKAKSLLGPSCASTLWDRVLLASKSVGWELTIDMFEAAANAKLQRFMSWTDETGSE